MDASSPPDIATAGSRRRLVLAAVGVAAALAVLKAFAFGLSDSLALLASLAATGLELVAALGAAFTLRLRPGEGGRRDDRLALTGLFWGLLGVIAALVIGWMALGRMVEPQPVTAGAWAVGAIVVSMLAALLLARLRAGRLRATQTLDLGPEAVALIGAASGAFLGASALDAAAAAALAVWLFWGGATTLKTSGARLFGRRADAQTLDRLCEQVMADPRVLAVRGVEARLTGDVLRASMRVALASGLTLKTARRAADEAEARVRDAFPGAEVRIEPEPADAVAATGVPATE